MGFREAFEQVVHVVNQGDELRNAIIGQMSIQFLSFGQIMVKNKKIVRESDSPLVLNGVSLICLRHHLSVPQEVPWPMPPITAHPARYVPLA